MARKKLTPEQQAAKVAKMKATKAANKAKAMAEVGYRAPKKVRRKRKPMTAEQKAAARDRLAKARAARGVTGLAAVHDSIKGLPESNPLNPTAVKQWLKSNKEELNSMKPLKDSKEYKDRLAYQSQETYVHNLDKYLKTGIWLDNRWGEKREFKMGIKVLTKAYNEDGCVKRNKGFWYDDIGISEVTL